jgi:hypothetical protein
MAVVRHTLDLYVLLLNSEVQLLQVVDAVHIPSHMVEPHLPFLGPWSVLSHLHQGDFVGITQVRSHEGRPSRRKPVGVETQEVLIPIAGALRVAHEDIDVSKFSRLVTHISPSSARVIVCDREYHSKHPDHKSPEIPQKARTGSQETVVPASKVTRWLSCTKRPTSWRVRRSVASLVKPDAILAWHSRRIVKTFDGSQQRPSPGRPKIVCRPGVNTTAVAT